MLFYAEGRKIKRQQDSGGKGGESRKKEGEKEREEGEKGREREVQWSLTCHKGFALMADSIPLSQLSSYSTEWSNTEQLQ